MTQLVGINVTDERVLPWRSMLSRQPIQFKPVQTRATDPAILLYTSGTTGAPKGALLPHSVLIGNLPGLNASQNWFPQPGDVFWSPARLGVDGRHDGCPASDALFRAADCRDARTVFRATSI